MTEMMCVIVKVKKHINSSINKQYCRNGSNWKYPFNKLYKPVPYDIIKLDL